MQYSETKDSSISYVNTRCVRAACDRLGIPYTNAATPFNSSAVDKVCKDKEFTWKLLADVVQMPKTKGYFDPYPMDEQYAGYIRETDYEAIADDISNQFSFPMIVKMNAGQKGRNVFLCEDTSQVLTAVSTIFDHESAWYDYVALAQEYIPARKEYRVITFKSKIVLLYEKDISEGTFTGNLSPLHYENAKAQLVEDGEVIEKLQKAIDPLFLKLDLEFGGIDVIVDMNDQLQILELNTHPGFTYFVKDNGDEPLVKMYEGILKGLR
jgi:glutathione synthase/RimK-type ligase-like ATP-grasp enzyme